METSMEELQQHYSGMETSELTELLKSSTLTQIEKQALKKELISRNFIPETWMDTPDNIDEEKNIKNQKNENDSLSRWWILFHLWGGVCLKAYSDVSGLSQLLLGSLRGSGHSAASSYAGTAAIIAVGTVALGYFLSKFLVNSINSGRLPNKGKLIVKILLPIGYLAGAIFLAMATAPLFIPPVETSQTSVPKSQPKKSSTIKPVKAYTTIQSAEGATEADLDQEGLKGLENWIVETMLKKGRNNFTALGYNPKEFKPKLDANSVYVTAGGKKLAIVKINMDDSMRSVTVMGIIGTELHRVSCIRSSNHDIPIWLGPCGDKIYEVFGVSVRP
ncbi:hypothetical protein [Marinobacter gelidimuriae]|uniref:hypothetical protein n=1 Tax=Marinobacter gelidimuriae TaxID=2739064 RepID=UPI0003754699|nr:hypothetical protein [Marinobacter gelidimuriae]